MSTSGNETAEQPDGVTPPENQYQQVQVPKGYVVKRKKPFYRRFWFIGLVFVTIIGIIIAASSGGGNDTNPSVSKGDGGAGGNSQIARSGDTVHLDKMDVTVDNFRASAGAMGNSVCADVHFVVTGDDKVTLNGLTDWSMTDPGNVTMSEGFSEETKYDPVDLGAGATYDGTVCFDSEGTPGEYTLNYEEGLSFTSTDKAEWKLDLE